ncbi:hypothetical protein, partial [Vibrio vulnificus]|uniref:hypothetical protein n=1 Tax=Vibrio vulnificus TaxID=672 RepID=UPI001CCE9A39
MSTEWTDEKHSLYLKSMEASFVNDLYNSFNLLGYRLDHPSDPNFSRRKLTASRASSGQFKVLQRGCWEKINFERNRSRCQ